LDGDGTIGLLGDFAGFDVDLLSPNVGGGFVCHFLFLSGPPFGGTSVNARTARTLNEITPECGPLVSVWFLGRNEAGLEKPESRVPAMDARHARHGALAGARVKNHLRSLSFLVMAV
jgi:hypothetical protein